MVVAMAKRLSQSSNKQFYMEVSNVHIKEKTIGYGKEAMSKCKIQSLKAFWYILRLKYALIHM